MITFNILIQVSPINSGPQSSQYPSQEVLHMWPVSNSILPFFSPAWVPEARNVIPEVPLLL